MLNVTPFNFRRGGARRFRLAGGFRAFTLVEILIIVTIIGVLAMVVIPQFSNASQQVRQNTLKDDLQYLRTQVTVFKAQHQDVPPGYPNANPLFAPTVAVFTSQMTLHSDINCNLSRSVSPAFPYGPYLGQLPMNPINNSTSVEMVGNNQPLPAPDGSTGWIYKPQTQEIIANLKGNDDSGTPFSSY
jgi:type II secretory pathway pseudopilin PulG